MTTTYRSSKRQFYFNQDSGVTSGKAESAGYILCEEGDYLRVTRISCTYGITDDPIDEKLSFTVDVVNDLVPAGTEFTYPVPQVGALTPIWQKKLNWRTIGTDAGPTQTLFHSDSEMDIEVHLGKVDEGDGAGGRTQCLMAYSTSSTTSTILFSGVIEYERFWRQRDYKRPKLSAITMGLSK